MGLASVVDSAPAAWDLFADSSDDDNALSRTRLMAPEQTQSRAPVRNVPSACTLTRYSTKYMPDPDIVIRVCGVCRSGDYRKFHTLAASL
jgi:hypothetical protein